MEQGAAIHTAITPAKVSKPHDWHYDRSLTFLQVAHRLMIEGRTAQLGGIREDNIL